MKDFFQYLQIMHSFEGNLLHLNEEETRKLGGFP